ncbi:hypothetical protein BX616_001907 [Lobosporangium transversale]|uniref:Uncharacterized protein n=1 Tax=Lobosporangium transversale TaxID=64571 RepID=A0A1Y2H1G4_9FUNG|nr:hypothetical protein BCR41DRAFT_178061 [Lobosporangium transversale]KAF9902533.1 hypothetical protein BX616_001907 [Lobosporangium transversale]ORZ26892.1 hypothetical protein BCR41DRAFT_178061 [Lobosporangium transversale]|eukprot:XP_021884639.1 hypothetical protein BCR41DRAFT_178061 [Lobosporangium transversale]
MKHNIQSIFPPTTSSNSDSEDLYGESETEERPHSPNSEPISHLSDNDDPTRSLSVSPILRVSHGDDAHSDSDLEDEDNNLASYSLLSQDFNQNSVSQRERGGYRVQDDFFLVEQSDFEPSSRPHSSLSCHLEHGRPEDPMHFIYPSMALSSAQGALNELSDETKGGISNNDKLSFLDRESHIPTHDLVSGIDSSLETISGTCQASLPGASQEAQPILITNTDPKTSLAQSPVNTAVVEGQHVVFTEVPAENTSMASSLPMDLHETEVVGSQNEKILTAADIPADVSDELSDHISIRPTWNLLIALRAIGLVLFLMLAGILAANYRRQSIKPAHVKVDIIEYPEDSLAAYISLSVYTASLKQVNHPGQSPGFHIRVLEDSRPMSLDEAPAHLSCTFDEPAVKCQWAGSCQVYIGVKQGQLPKGCSDRTYYLHLWFANGTRAWDSSPEIFTDSEESRRKSSNCRKRPFFRNYFKDSDYYDDFIAFFNQWRELQNITTKASGPWRDLSLNNILPTIPKLQDAARIAEECRLKSYNYLVNALQYCKSAPGLMLDLITRGFEWVWINAERTTNHISLTVQKVVNQAKHRLGFYSYQKRSSWHLKKQIWVLQKTVKDKFDKLPVGSIIHKMDETLMDMEDNLESLLHSKQVKAVMKRLYMDEIQHWMEELADEVEIRVKRAKRNLRRKVNKFKATPTGDKLVRKARAIQEDVKWLWRDFLQWRMQHLR